MSFVGRICYSQEMPVEEYLACCGRSAVIEEEAEAGEERWWTGRDLTDSISSTPPAMGRDTFH